MASAYTTATNIYHEIKSGCRRDKRTAIKAIAKVVFSLDAPRNGNLEYDGDSCFSRELEKTFILTNLTQGQCKLIDDTARYLLDTGEFQ